ncbi:FAD-binding oxidoreductase [Ramlibacter sp.]|uniref:FAD-binding oxidoreductase n=1 Tax=Ramlibacter sp. TaxID=1917967 RepID=UPI002C4F240E|nr:FAD-binding oxidoreductase [Ramlibacter sp.]HWI83476.1 FAD-binding oxidoreductase [Ramlibacter sp.]
MKRLQALLQWCFMHLEALFNRAFGDRMNPLYHLGAMSFFLFWVVAASGLYLYAFFETGVAEAYSSVAALTHGQWFAGGLLRSAHRYASDAMVVTMTVHLLRHFAFDRFRGFRWFSWTTGVAIIWLLYACGINGYMLPWDRLAQFVIVGAFEWLDWLPSFGGTLMRNFIHRDSVGDRFFSLLSFMHIGLPLFLLLLLWVHVQRVPKARTTPPRPIVIGLLAVLAVLAVARPVTSQGGPADLGSAVAGVQLDWFYLPVFPLINEWPLGRVWALLGAGTALLLLVPLWPPRRRRREAAEHLLVVHGERGPARELHVRAGETLLEAGLREGLALPYECRSGGCGKCLCSVEHGRVEHRPYQRAALPDSLQAQGKALLCCAMPLEDVVIEVEGLVAAAGTELALRSGQVVALERLAPDVMRVLIELPPGERLAFAAGQYINIVLADGQRRAFSFANPPHQAQRIELHVRRIPGGRFTGHVFDGLKVGDTLQFEGPLGTFTLRKSGKPLLFVAGATGFAPVKSILEDAFQRGVQRPMRLYWGVRRRSDLYLLALARQWQREHPNFEVVPVLSEPRPEDHWDGRTGLVHEAMLADHGDLTGFEVYVCGSLKMVETAVPAFVAHGLGEGACFSDAFLPAAGPRLAGA